MAWYWFLLGFWTLGWLIHVIILSYSWWSGRLWWTATTNPYREPQMLYFSEVLGFSFVGIAFWWIWVIWETDVYLEKARNNHVEYVKKMNRPIEEVAAELNLMLNEEGGEQIDLPQHRGPDVIRVPPPPAIVKPPRRTQNS